MIKHGILKRVITWVAMAMLFFTASAALGAGPATVRVERQNSRFSVQAKHAPLLKVLSELGSHIEANLFLTDSLAAIPIDVDCQNVTLVKALRCVLRDFDFIASFSRNAKGEDDISLIKIYPKGKRSGNLIQVASGGHGRGSGSNQWISQNLGHGQGRLRPNGPLPGATLGSPQAERQSLPPAGHSVITAGTSFIAKRDVAQQLDLQLQAIAQDQWGIQHAAAVSFPESAASTNATTESADVAAAKAQTETMQEDVNAGMDRLQFLQQSDASSFVVTLTEAASTPQ